MKNTTETVQNTAKELNDAITAFSGTLTRNWMEVQAKNWEEMVKFSETATKLAQDVYKDVPFFKGMNSFNSFWNK